MSVKSSPSSCSKILTNSDGFKPRASAIFQKVTNLQSISALSILLKLLSLSPYSLANLLLEKEKVDGEEFAAIFAD